MNYIRLFSVGLVCLSLWSCREDKLSSDARTGFCISLTEADETVETRSTPKELGKPAVDQFKLKIVSCTTGDAIYEDGYTSDFIPALTDVYDVTASFGDNAVLAYDAPYYEGKKEDVAVEEKKITSLEVECTVANALASVTFDQPEKFEALYSSYILEVSVDKFSLELNGTDGKSAYYRANSKPTFTFKGVLKETGKSVEAVLENEVLDDPATFAAKAHCRLTLALKDMVPGVIPTITKAEVETVTVSETLPMEWLPAPKVSATGFDESNTVSVYETGETDTASIDFTVAQSLQDLSFTLNFADENLQSLNKTYQLSTMTEDEKQSFEDAGITLPQIGSANPRMIFPKEFISTLHSSNEGTVTNTLTINSVKANDRENVDAQTYTIAVHKPEFTVSVLPGNIWTKEFTVSALTEEQVEKGDFSKLSQNMTYQFSTDGSTDWTDLGKDLRKAELTPNTSYFVRGVYRNEICSAPVEVKTYPIIELENGGMEAWTTSEIGYYYNTFAWNKYPLLTYNPWSGDNQYWNTNNDFTTRHRDQWSPPFSTIYYYNSFPAVSYTKDVHGGNWAAVLRNTAAGRGNTSSSSSSYDFNNVPGELFIGGITITTGGSTVKPDGDHYDIDEGTEFVSRPTGLRFYYKYAPYMVDAWKVYIALYDEAGNIIAENTVTDGNEISTYKEMDISFNYVEDLDVIPAKVYVYFASSIYSGSELPYHSMEVTTWYNNSQRTDETLSGSVFCVDDISLVYDK